MTSYTLQDLKKAIAEDNLAITILAVSEANENPPENFINDFNFIDLIEYKNNESFNYTLENLNYPKKRQVIASIEGEEAYSQAISNNLDFANKYVEKYLEDINEVTIYFIIKLCAYTKDIKSLYKLKNRVENNAYIFDIDLLVAIISNDVPYLKGLLHKNNPIHLKVLDIVKLLDLYNNDATNFVIGFGNFVSKDSDFIEQAKVEAIVKNQHLFTKKEITNIIYQMKNSEKINRLAYLIQDFNLLVREEA